MLGVQQSVSGEVYVTVLGQFVAGRGRLIGGEIQCAKSLIGWRERQYHLGLLARVWKPAQNATGIAQVEIPRRSGQITLKQRRVGSTLRHYCPPGSARDYRRFESLVSGIKDGIGQRRDGLRRRLAPG